MKKRPTRTFKDAEGYWRKRPKNRSKNNLAPQFGTVREYEEWIKNKQREGLAKNETNRYGGAPPKDEVSERLKELIEQIEQVVGNEKKEVPDLLNGQKKSGEESPSMGEEDQE